MSTITLEPNEIRIDLSYFSEPHIEWVVENGVGVVRVQEQPEKTYQIIENSLQISGSRLTVYDVLEAHNKGMTREQICFSRNLVPEQVDVALNYIKEHKARLDVELHEIIRKSDEQRQQHDEIAEGIKQKIAQKQMTPERQAFYALRDEHQQARDSAE